MSQPKQTVAPSEAKDEGPNFECLCRKGTKPCGEVFESKQQINAHILHGHKVKVGQQHWQKTSKEVTRPSKYAKRVERQQRTAATIGGIGRGKQVSGTLSVPIILTFDFTFTTPVISQEVAPQHIDLSGGRRRGRRSSTEE